MNNNPFDSFGFICWLRGGGSEVKYLNQYGHTTYLIQSSGIFEVVKEVIYFPGTEIWRNINALGIRYHEYSKGCIFCILHRPRQTILEI